MRSFAELSSRKLSCRMEMDCYDPQIAPPMTVLGGDFLYPSDPAKRSASPFGDFPYNGSYSIGMRIVRR